MLATHCACCGRPLCDANSVELGIGPVCRKTHGFDEAQSEPNFDAACVLCDSLTERGVITTATAQSEINKRDARKSVNALVHAAALVQGQRSAAEIAQCISALGYTLVAGKIASWSGAVSVHAVDGKLQVHTPFSADASNAWRFLGGRFDRKTKTRTIDNDKRAQLWNLLRRFFAGETIVTDSGVSTIPKLPVEQKPVVKIERRACECGNGRFTRRNGTESICFRCRGKSWQDASDIARNRAYDAHRRGVSA